jgi:hypothetical protein
MAEGMTRRELLRLGAEQVTCDLMTAARALGIGRTLAHDLARKGTFPCQVQKLGAKYRVVTGGPRGLLAACGVTDHPTGVPAQTPPAAA